MGYLAVAIGGAMGAVARYGLSGWVMTWSAGAFPWGTLTVNVLGSLLIGALLHLGLERMLLSAEMRLIWVTGFCGSLTTFSTFSFETLELLRDQQWLAAGGNVLLNVLACLAATYLGLVLGRLL